MVKQNSGKSWLLIAWNVLHLTEAKKADLTWWCVDRQCAVGDRCFLYKSLKGIILLFEVLKLNESQGFCRSFGMATAEVRVLEIFDSPLTAKALKQFKGTCDANFVRRNFQGKAFAIDKNVNQEILKLAASQKNQNNTIT